MKRIALLVLFVVVAVAALSRAEATVERWKTIVTPADVYERLSDPQLLIVDVRSADKYAAGHIPGAINVPGDRWRTPEAKPGHGDSQYIFRTADGSPDITRYETFLGQAGISPQHHVVIYGNHAGKADGSVPAMILTWLGHANVTFLDGVGIEQWKAAGYEISTEPRTLAPTTYAASRPIEQFVWNLDDVVANIGNPDVIFYDTRSTKEFTGEDRRDNRHGGRIPGAVLCDYAEFLDNQTKTVLAPADVRKKLAERNITPDKTVVLYCQTATRVSLPVLTLRDLGYTKVAIYDASWHEYGNRDDTPIELPETAAAATEK